MTPSGKAPRGSGKWSRVRGPANASRCPNRRGSIRRQLSPAQYQVRQEWLAAVRSQGLLAGTLDHLLRLTG